MKNKIKKGALKTMVMESLKNFEETRNSDIELTLCIWNQYYPHLIRTGKEGQQGVYLKDIFDLPREDNVKRLRAHIQNVENLYLPTVWAIAKKRKIEENRWRQFFGYPPKGHENTNLFGETVKNPIV